MADPTQVKWDPPKTGVAAVTSGDKPAVKWDEPKAGSTEHPNLGFNAKDLGTGVKNVVNNYAQPLGQVLNDPKSLVVNTPKEEHETWAHGAHPEHQAMIPGVVHQMDDMSDEGMSDIHNGKTMSGIMKILGSMAPVVGPYMSEKMKDVQAGNIGGTAVEVIGTLLAPHLLKESLKRTGANAMAVKDAFPKHAIAAASNNMLNDGYSEVTKDIKAPIDRWKTHIGANFSDIKMADQADSAKQGRTGFIASRDLSQQLLKQVADNGANPKAPEIMAARRAIAALPGDVPIDRVKNLRGDINDLMKKAPRAEGRALTSFYDNVSKTMRDRGKALGKEDQFDAYSEETKALTKHGDILDELKKPKSGLEGFNVLAKGSNGPALKALEADLNKYGLKKGYFEDVAKKYNPIHKFASESDKWTVKGATIGRIQALAKHPAVAGSIIAAAAASPLPYQLKYIVGILGAMKASDILDRMDAAKRINEMGGAKTPQGYLGNYPQVNPTGVPGGGGGGIPPVVGAGGGSPSPSPSPTPQPQPTAQPQASVTPPQKLLEAAKAQVDPTTATVSNNQEEPQKLLGASPGAKQEKIESARIDDPKWIEGEKQHEATKLKAIIRNKDATPEEKKIAASQLKDYQAKPEVKKVAPEAASRGTKARERMAKGRAEAKAAQPTAPKRNGVPMVDPGSYEHTSVAELEEEAKQHDSKGLVMSALKKMKASGALSQDEYQHALKEFISSNQR